MSGSRQAAGWYPAEGDPPGTVRWWDGAQWVGGPQQQGAQQQDGYVAPGVKQIANGRELADPWRRIGASLIDGIVIFIFGSIVGAATGVTVAFSSLSTGDEDPELGAAVLVVQIIVAVVIAAYYVLMNSLYSGGIGKQILGLRIVQADGTEPLGTSVGVKRSANQVLAILTVLPLIGPVLGVSLGLLSLVSLVFLFTDADRRTVMDRFADTYVVAKQK